MTRLAVLFFLLPFALAAQDETAGYDSAVLVGIKSVRIGSVVLITESLQEATGWSQARLEERMQAILELEFRRAGLLVDSSSNVIVMYTLDISLTPNGIAIYTQNLQVWEPADRLRTAAMESDFALTWRYGSLVYWTRLDGLIRTIEDRARDMADSFLIHYLRANPR